MVVPLMFIEATLCRYNPPPEFLHSFEEMFKPDMMTCPEEDAKYMAPPSPDSDEVALLL
jgi:hypothetical protein